MCSLGTVTESLVNACSVKHCPRPRQALGKQERLGLMPWGLTVWLGDQSRGQEMVSEKVGAVGLLLQLLSSTDCGLETGGTVWAKRPKQPLPGAHSLMRSASQEMEG